MYNNHDGFNEEWCCSFINNESLLHILQAKSQFHTSALHESLNHGQTSSFYSYWCLSVHVFNSSGVLNKPISHDDKHGAMCNENYIVKRDTPIAAFHRRVLLRCDVLQAELSFLQFNEFYKKKLSTTTSTTFEAIRK